MSIDVRLPQLADSDTKAKVSVWLKHEGDHVTGGEPLVEVETDKTTVEIEAPSSGRLLKIHAPEGTDGLEVGGHELAPVFLMKQRNRSSRLTEGDTY